MTTHCYIPDRTVSNRSEYQQVHTVQSNTSLKNKGILQSEDTIIRYHMSKKIAIQGRRLCPGSVLTLQGTSSVPDSPPSPRLGVGGSSSLGQGGGQLWEEGGRWSQHLLLGVDAGRAAQQISENPPQPGDNTRREFFPRETGGT